MRDFNMLSKIVLILVIPAIVSYIICMEIYKLDIQSCIVNYLFVECIILFTIIKKILC